MEKGTCILLESARKKAYEKGLDQSRLHCPFLESCDGSRCKLTDVREKKARTRRVEIYSNAPQPVNPIERFREKLLVAVGGVKL